MRKVAVTGSNGFVGSSLCDELINAGYSVRKIVRDRRSYQENQIEIGEINEFTDWSVALKGVDTIIHCAAYAHDVSTNQANVARLLLMINLNGTVNLAKQAVTSGVRRLIFLSSIKVIGNKTSLGHPYTHFSIPDPKDVYGQSKLGAEIALNKIGEDTGLEVVIIRSPLVYGPNVRANFLSLLKLISNGIYLPFKGIKNKRSLVSLDNLIDLIILCIEHQQAVGQTFLISDGNDLSTPELIARLAESMGLPARLVWVPTSVLMIMGAGTGKQSKIERLTNSLQVDISHTSQTLSWNPPKPVEESFLKTSKWYSNYKLGTDCYK
jgi:nucleoside-diphosphate-sugar epimerase